MPRGREDDPEKLFEAIRRGKTTCVKTLLQNGCSPNSRVGDETFTPALVLAVKHKKPNCVQTLLRFGAKVDDRDRSGTTAYLCAAERGLLDILKILASFNANVNAVDNEKMTALMLASRWGKDECVSYLLEMRPDVNQRDVRGRTALMYAAIENADQCLHLLIDAGADVNIVDSECGYSALMLALQHRAPSCVNILLHRGAEVNVVAKDRKTTVLTKAIHDAKQNGGYGILEKLLRLGADMRLSHEDQDFLHEIVARAGNQRDITASTDFLRLVRLMVINGCPPLDRRCWEPVVYKFSHHHMPISPLCVALLSGCYDIAKYFVVNRFFTKYDVTTLPNDPDIRKKLQDLGIGGEEALNVLNHLCGLPQSLGVLSFVAISEMFTKASVERGDPTQRMKLIKQSGLPPSLQKELLFQGSSSRICVLHWHDLCLEKDQDVEKCSCSDCGSIGGFKIKRVQPSYFNL